MNTYVTGSTIKQLREKRNMTQAELAAKIGVSSKAYNRNKARNWKRESDPIPGILLHNARFSDILTENLREVPL